MGHAVNAVDNCCCCKQNIPTGSREATSPERNKAVARGVGRVGVVVDLRAEGGGGESCTLLATEGYNAVGSQDMVALTQTNKLLVCFEDGHDVEEMSTDIGS